MRTLLTCLVVATLGVAAACGGTSSPLLDAADDAGAGDGGSKRDGSTRDGGSCVNPTSGETCVAGESVCGQVGQGNPCCDQAWRCIGGKWQSLAADCACNVQSEACGDKTCQPGQYCQVQPPGIALPDGGSPGIDYECFDPPASCGGVATCSCLEAAATCEIDSCTTSQGEVQTLPTVNCIGE